LLEAGLIAPAEGSEIPAFSFHHALLQDAAYASLLRSERRSLHRAVGEVLEADYDPASDALEWAPRLGEHFQEAGDSVRAQAFFIQAGDAADDHYANAEAIAHFRRALTSIDSQTVEPEKMQHVLLSLGQAFELSGRHAEALSAYEQLELFASERGVSAVRHAAVMARAKIYATLTPEHDAERAGQLLEQALGEVRSRHDDAEESKVLWNLMVLRMWSGEDYSGAVELGQQAVELARRADDTERLAFALNDLAYPYVATDRLAEARAVIVEAQPLWRAAHNIPMLVDNLSQAVLLHYHFGDFAAGEADALEAMRRSDEIGNVWGQTNSRLYYGLILQERGQIGPAIDTMQAAIRLGDVSRHPGALVGARTDLGLLLSELGELDRATRLIEEAESIAAEIGPSVQAYPAASKARLALRGGDESDARTSLARARGFLRPAGLQWFAPVLIPAIEAELALADGESATARSRLGDLMQTVETMPIRPWLPEVLRLTSRTLSAVAEVADAMAILDRARREAQAMGSDWRLFPILVDLGRILESTGDRTGWNDVIQEARALLRRILPTVPEGQTRDAFQGRPDIRAVLSG
jgi:tetratricopeptide (TPR) repeat protein